MLLHACWLHCFCCLSASCEFKFEFEFIQVCVGLKLGKTQLKHVSPTQTLATRPNTPNLETSPNSPGNSTQIPRGPSFPFPLSQACGPPHPAAAAQSTAQHVVQQPNPTNPTQSGLFPFLGPAAAHTRTPAPARPSAPARQPAQRPAPPQPALAPCE